jgi:hypothetical protein
VIPQLPLFITWLFSLTVLLTLALFLKATNFLRIIIIFLSTWIVIQSILGFSEFYLNTNSIPPRFILLLLPPIIFILILFLTEKGKRFIDSIDIKFLTLLHIIRIPVEIILYWLFVYKKIPILMTFEGRNFDIISGLTAPIIFYYGFVNVKFGKKVIIAWNYLCLVLLLNIVFNSVLSSPFPLQKFAFEQPNVAILYFPFNLLPSLIVPIVLLSHLVVIRRLSKSE